MIEQISNHLAIMLSANTSTDSNHKDINLLKYGIECIINISIPLLVIFIYSVFQHSYFEMLIWTISFLLLRKYLGGYHAPTHISCIIISCFYGIFSLYLINIFSKLQIKLMFLVCIILLIINSITGPVIYDHDLIDKKKLFAKINIIILMSLSLLLLILSFISKKISSSIFVGICSSEFLYFISIIISFKNSKKDLL